MAFGVPISLDDAKAVLKAVTGAVDDAKSNTELKAAALASVSPAAGAAYYTWKKVEEPVGEAVEGATALSLWVLGMLQWMVDHPARTLMWMSVVGGAVFGGAGFADTLGRLKATEITE